jgi:hypothetical protein
MRALIFPEMNLATGIIFRMVLNMQKSFLYVQRLHIVV